MTNILLKNAAHILGISVTKLRTMVRNGEITPTGYNGGLGGRTMMFDSSEIYALERKRKNEKHRRIKIRTK